MSARLLGHCNIGLAQSELWDRRNGSWQIVWEQATAIPNNFDLFLQSIEPPGRS